MYVGPVSLDSIITFGFNNYHAAFILRSVNVSNININNIESRADFLSQDVKVPT